MVEVDQRNISHITGGDASNFSKAEGTCSSFRGDTEEYSLSKDECLMMLQMHQATRVKQISITASLDSSGVFGKVSVMSTPRRCVRSL